MNFNNVKDIVLSSLKKIKELAGELLRLPYAKSYIALSFIMIIIFIIITFPYDIILKSQIQNLEGKQFQSVIIGEIDTGFFQETEIESLHLTLKNRNEISLKKLLLDLTLNPYTLFVNNNIMGSFQVDQTKLIFKNFNSLLKANGEFDFVYDSSKRNFIQYGKGKIMISNAAIHIDEFNASGFPITLPPINIKAAIAEFSINKKNMVIRKFNISGNDLRGSIKGKIILGKFIKNSRIKLLIDLDSTSKVLKDYKTLLTSYIDDKGRIKIKITGTFAQPVKKFVKVNRPASTSTMGNTSSTFDLNRNPKTR